MTEDRFDQLTQRLATVSMSRRGAIGVIGGLLAGAVASCSSGIKRASAPPGQLPQQIYGSQPAAWPAQSPDPLGQEAAFAEAVLSSGAEVVLICYEHNRIPALVQGIPTVDGSAIPAVWPGDRFDVIWTFTLDRDGGRYVFGQVPQQLLGGDTDTVI